MKHSLISRKLLVAGVAFGIAISAIPLSLVMAQSYDTAPSRIQPPTVTLSQSADTTTSDGTTAQSFTFSWSSKDATACTIQKINPDGVLTNPWATGTSGTQQIAPYRIGSHHWWIDCMGPGGTARQDMYHTVVSSTPQQRGAPTVTLTQDKAQTTTAEQYTVTWTSTNADSCTLQRLGVNGVLYNPWQTGNAGSHLTSQPNVGTTHTWIDCTGPGGTAHADLYHVSTAPTPPTGTPPEVTLTQDKTQTLTTEQYTVSWSSKKADSCTLQRLDVKGNLTNPWQTGTSGSVLTSQPYVGTSHIWIDCTGQEEGTAYADLYHVSMTATPPAGQFGSTPISLTGNYPRQSNHIQTMIYMTFPNTDLFSYFAKEMDYVWFDQSSFVVVLPDGSRDLSKFPILISALNAANPAIKIGVHAGAGGFLAPRHLVYPYLSDSDFLHNNAGQVLYVQSGTATTTNKYINVYSATTRQTIVNAWIDMFSKNSALTGINIDGYQSYAHDPALQSGCQEGPCSTQNFWFSGLEALSTSLMRVLPGKDITYNGIYIVSGNSDATLGTMNSGFIAYNNGVLAEHAHRMYVSPDYFAQYLSTIDSITAQNKKVFFWIQPQILPLTDPTVTFTNDANLQRFFLSSYLLIQNNPYTYYGYHPGVIYNSGPGLYFYPEWNMDYGIPTTRYSALANGLYARTYSNGIAVVNPTTSSQTYDLPSGRQYRAWDKNNGRLASGSVTVPAKTGMFYFVSSTTNALSGSSESPSSDGSGGSGGSNSNQLQTSTPVTQSSGASSAGYSFTTSLQFGMTGQDVTKLQQFLAQDPSVYPKGIVSGYFGPLTKQAVIHFQEKYASEILQPLGLSNGTGTVGPATLKKLNALVK